MKMSYFRNIATTIAVMKSFPEDIFVAAFDLQPEACSAAHAMAVTLLPN